MKQTKLSALELIVIALILAMLFWPVPVDAYNGPLHGIANAIFDFISLHPSLQFATYWVIEKTSNLLLFIPLGYIARRHLNSSISALALATLVTVSAELAQKYIITNRVFAIDDIIANVLGAALGIALQRLFRQRTKTR